VPQNKRRWLNPPEWIEPLAAKDARLKKQTLTNLYNKRPTWLRLAHEQLDRAVLAAYAAADPAGDWSEDWAEVWTDTGAGQPLPADHPLANKRAEVDQWVLANLLRLNHARAKGEAADAPAAAPITCEKSPAKGKRASAGKAKNASSHAGGAGY
jgi:hypothetical protein